MGTSTRAIVRERLTMKFTAALLTLTAAERNGKTDAQGIHIGGGAFDAGTPEGVALWAIRKCRKKICHSWSFGRCPINDIGELDGQGYTQSISYEMDHIIWSILKVDKLD